MHNAIYIRRRSKVLLPDDTGTTPLRIVATVQKNLESLGFRFAEEVCMLLQLRSPEVVTAFAAELIASLREVVGAHRSYRPLYPNFPTEVMDMNEAELYWNALQYYWDGTKPDTKKERRSALKDEVTYRELRLGTRSEFEQIPALLLQAKTPFSPTDAADLAWFVQHDFASVQRGLPSFITCKENLGTFGGLLLKHQPQSTAYLTPYIIGATDILRIAVGYSGGDVSLADSCKFTKFPRSLRVLLLGWLEGVCNRTEDMLRWEGRWVRLGERLHPGEYAKRFPQTADAFDVLRNQRPFATFNSTIEHGLAVKDTANVLELLRVRPGELARRLDHLARTSTTPQAVVDAFMNTAQGVSTPVLLQVLTHFRHRSEPRSLRAFFPKGQVGNLFATTKLLPWLHADIATQLTDICSETLVDRFAKLPPLGACYLDPALQYYLVPFGMRSAAKELRTLVRGSRLPLPDCSTLRFFVWWKNGNSRVDVDLSAALYDTNANYIDALTYYNLKNFGGHHSGDITDAPNGAAEFIDVGIEACLAANVRYIVMCLNSYSGQPYCDLPECFAGWMARQAPNSGEVFEAKTVQDKVDVAANTRICLPAIFDLHERQVIWSDIALNTHPHFANNVKNNLSGVSLMLRAMTNLVKPDLFTLFALHIAARGHLVDTPEEATTVFGITEGLTPFDLDQISAKWL